MSTCWRSLAPKVVRLHRWVDQVAVYNDRSGDTHLLEGLAVEILLRLRAVPLSEPDLVQELAQQLGLSVGEEQENLRSWMTAALQSLEGVGLIERVPAHEVSSL